MKITVQGHANIRHYFPDKNETHELEIAENIKLSAILERFNIPESEVMLLMINGAIASKDQLIMEKDYIEIFPILSGG